MRPLEASYRNMLNPLWGRAVPLEKETTDVSQNLGVKSRGRNKYVPGVGEPSSCILRSI